MNTLGKVLVFINLVFSLIVGALIIMVFITRTQWQAGYAKISADLVRENQNHENVRKAYDRLRADKEVEITNITNDKTQTAGKLADSEARLAEANKKLQNTEADNVAKQATIDQLKTLVENRETEVRRIDKLLKDREQQNNDLLVSNKGLAEEKIKYEIAYTSAKERNEKLMEQYQILLKQFEAYRLGDAAKTRTLISNPPPEDVYGRVKAADTESGLVTINIGSDSGLAKNQTLEVYRLAPKPTYVGTLRIMDVRPNEAVGKLMGTSRRGAIQVNDEVASQILSKR